MADTSSQMTPQDMTSPGEAPRGTSVPREATTPGQVTPPGQTPPGQTPPGQMPPPYAAASGNTTYAGTRPSAVDRANQALTRRPGLVTYAAVMMFLFAGFQFTWAVVEFANAAWITNATYGTFGGYLWLWGLLDLAFALLAGWAGYDILTGGRFGQVFGLVVAILSAIRWFFYLPAAPVAGVVMIALDVLIIYALVAHAEYFGTRTSTAV